MFKLPKNTANRARLLEQLMETGAKLLDADAGSILLLDSESGRLCFMAATGEKKDQLMSFFLKPGQGIAGHVVMEGKSVVVNDAAGDGRWYRRISESMGVRTQSIACAPLRLNGLTVGVIEFIHNGDGKVFRDEDIEILTSISELAVFAVKKTFTAAYEISMPPPLLDVGSHRKKIIGTSPQLLKAVEIAEKAAPTDASVLLMGESGVGKELMARLIHENSRRFGRPLISINCAAIADNLLESELFGHEKGSFTGASYRGLGKFELADSGTLFLDEVGEMTPNMQKKLLRVLQEGRFFRVGGRREKFVDVRIIAATNKDLIDDVNNGVFRQDLYYRLNIVPIRVPPLRDRTADIPLLMPHILKNLCSRLKKPIPVVTQEATRLLMQYQWPGNIRELSNVLERALILDRNKILDTDDFQMTEELSQISLTPNSNMGYREAVDAFKRSYLADALRMNDGSRIRTARELKLQRSYLSRLLKKHDVV
jgi:Nif-specific regulatory protein